MVFKTAIVVADMIFFSRYTSGHFDVASINTKKYCPLTNGPAKSTLKRNEGVAGMGYWACFLYWFLVSKQAAHQVDTPSSFLSNPGHHT